MPHSNSAALKHSCGERETSGAPKARPELYGRHAHSSSISFFFVLFSFSLHGLWAALYTVCLEVSAFERHAHTHAHAHTKTRSAAHRRCDIKKKLLFMKKKSRGKIEYET